MSLFESPQPITLLGGSECIAEARLQHHFTRKNFNGWVFESVIKGVGNIVVNGSEHVATKGDLYILPHGSDHCIYPDKEVSCHKVFLHARGDLITKLIQFYGLNDVYYFKNSRLSTQIRRILRARDENPHDFATRFPLLLHEFIALLHRSHFKSNNILLPPVVSDMLRYLHQHTEEFTSLDIMAEVFHCSKIHLIRQFKLHIGVTPWEYLLGRRLEQARWLLINSQDSVKSISNRLQFKDPHYFSNFFKKRTAETPSAFRSTHSLYF